MKKKVVALACVIYICMMSMTIGHQSNAEAYPLGPNESTICKAEKKAVVTNDNPEVAVVQIQNVLRGDEKTLSIPPFNNVILNPASFPPGE